MDHRPGLRGDVDSGAPLGSLAVRCAGEQPGLQEGKRKNRGTISYPLLTFPHCQHSMAFLPVFMARVKLGMETLLN